MASDNRGLGRFVLGDLPRMPGGAVRVEVSFTMDADGILHVSATDLLSGKATSVTIQAQSGLSFDDVARLAEGRAAVRGHVGCRFNSRLPAAQRAGGSIPTVDA